MYKKISKLLFIVFAVSLVFLLTWCAENEPLAPADPEQPIETILTAGPDEGATLAFNSTATFTWDGTVSPGYITAFTYTFVNTGTGDTIHSATDLQKSFSASGLATGAYSFSVYAHGLDDETELMDESPVVRNFTVGTADANAPVVTILQGPKANSYAATGASMFFEWEATDPSVGGSIVSYQYALADSSVDQANLTWSEATLVTSQKSYYNLPNATYRFWVKATDISGAEGIATRDFVVKEPDILFAIESAMTTADIEFWHENALRDFAYEDFHVTDAASFIAKLNSGQYSTVIWAWKNGYSAIDDSANYADVTAAGSLAEAVYNYEQAGGHLWIISSEVMWMHDDHGIPITGAFTFATNVLHAASYNEASNNFQGATSTGLSTYQNIIVDGQATFTWVDQINPTADAEAIYGFTPTQVAIDAGFGNGEPCGIRYPTTGETKVVFLGFYLTDSSQPAACKTEDVYNLATTVLTDMGENND